jgi:aspartate-semialdehyde dehydrogenase
MAVRVAVVGVTGLVGRTMLEVLAQRDFPLTELRPMASIRSAGSEIYYDGERLKIEEATPDAFKGLDIVLFSAGSTASRALAPSAASAGAVVIDNSSAWRLEPGVPLVVPEVNPEAAAGHQGIIANPNCCAIPLTVALKPVADLSPLRRVIVDTYQSASGKGWRLMEELSAQRIAIANGEVPAADVYPYVLEGNVIPGGWPYPPELAARVSPVYEDPHAASAYNEEELKIIAETRKILDLPDLPIACTTVRVPVDVAHSEAVWVETETPLSAGAVRARLEESPGIIVRDDPEVQLYPLAADVAGTDEVYVGRIRRDLSHERGIAMWVVADNLRKGAATNAVQVAELLLP